MDDQARLFSFRFGAQHDCRISATGAQISGRPPQQSCNRNTVDDRAAASFGRDQIGARKNCQVSRQRVLRHFQLAREIAGGEPIRLVLDENAERLQPRRLRERGKRQYGLFVIHISRFMEVLLSPSIEKRCPFHISKLLEIRLTGRGPRYRL